MYLNLWHALSTIYTIQKPSILLSLCLQCIMSFIRIYLLLLSLPVRQQEVFTVYLVLASAASPDKLIPQISLEHFDLLMAATAAHWIEDNIVRQPVGSMVLV